MTFSQTFAEESDPGQYIAADEPLASDAFIPLISEEESSQVTAFEDLEEEAVCESFERETEYELLSEEASGQTEYEPLSEEAERETEGELLSEETERETEGEPLSEEAVTELSCEESALETVQEVCEGETVNADETEADTAAESAEEEPFTGLAETGKCGPQVTWTYKSSDGTLILKGTGPTYDYEEGKSPFYNAWIQYVSVEDGITRISRNLFEACDRMIMATLPAGIETIADRAFYGCAELEQINFPSGLKKIGNEAFMRTNLVTVSLPDSVEKVGTDAFRKCEALKTVRLSASMKETGLSSFYVCSSLQSLTIPYGIETISQASFANCSSLTEVKLPSSVKKIQYNAFCFCYNLQFVKLSRCLSDIEGYVFYGCKALTAISLPSSLTSIGEYVFLDCSNLKKVFFYGRYPSIDANTFNDITANAYYPVSDTTWKTSCFQNYGGTITWQRFQMEDPDYPSPVYNLKASSSASGVTLTWSHDNGLVSDRQADGYLVYGIRPGSSYGYVGMVSGDNRKYIDGKASIEGWNYYWVFPYYQDEWGKMAVGKCEAYTYGRKTFTPAAVTNLKAASLIGSVKLSWSASSGATGYLIYGKNTNAQYHYIGMTSGLTYTDKNASAKNYNFYWVFPYYKDFTGKNWVGNCPKYVYAKAK